MRALILVAHPEPRSLTHSVASCVGEGLTEADPTSSFVIADLVTEGFDPRFTAADLAVHRTQSAPPPDVLREQARIDRADALVLVFPVYWWAMPALLKGWIDRVFSNGWAFDFSGGSKLVKKLGNLQVHLVGVGGADALTYARHGYAQAMRIQIDHGIFDYCGARVATSDLLLEAETGKSGLQLQAARSIGRRIIDDMHVAWRDAARSSEGKQPQSANITATTEAHR